MNEAITFLTQALGTAWAYYIAFGILTVWFIIYKYLDKAKRK